MFNYGTGDYDEYDEEDDYDEEQEDNRSSESEEELRNESKSNFLMWILGLSGIIIILVASLESGSASIFLILLFGLILFLMNYATEKTIESIRNQRKDQKTMEKRAAFEAWYASLPLHEQYLVDRQLEAAANSQQARAMAGAAMMNHYLHHD